MLDAGLELPRVVDAKIHVQSPAWGKAKQCIPGNNQPGLCGIPLGGNRRKSPYNTYHSTAHCTYLHTPCSLMRNILLLTGIVWEAFRALGPIAKSARLY